MPRTSMIFATCQVDVEEHYAIPSKNLRRVFLEFDYARQSVSKKIADGELNNPVELGHGELNSLFLILHFL
jgi:hypothetical protein